MSIVSCNVCHVNSPDHASGDAASERSVAADADSTWTFLTNHTHVLVCLAIDPTLRVKDLASRVGITERATHRILSELVNAGYASRVRLGRRNSYRLDLDHSLRHPLEASRPVRDLIEALAGTAGNPADGARLGLTRAAKATGTRRR